MSGGLRSLVLVGVFPLFGFRVCCEFGALFFGWGSGFLSSFSGDCGVFFIFLEFLVTPLLSVELFFCAQLIFWGN